MKNMPDHNRRMEMCLCSRCAGVFYGSKDYYIERSDPFQMIHEPCQICLSPYGYDFQINVRNTVMLGKSTFEPIATEKVHLCHEGRVHR